MPPQPPCHTGDCDLTKEVQEINKRLAKGDAELEDIKTIKRGVLSLLGVFILQAGMLLYYAGAQVQRLDSIGERLNRIEPQHNQLWYMHQKEIK